MKKLLKNTTIIIVIIMILLSSFVPNTSFADDDLPDYNGLPAGGRFGVVNVTGWLISSLKGIFDWFIGIVTYAIKAVFLGWTNIIEKAITGLVAMGTASDIDGSLTVEKIVSNQVPILDVNFFNFSQAGGRTLDDQSIVYQIRVSIAQFYYIIRNVTIAGMLVTLIYIGIRMAISSIAEAKAKYKSMLIGWVESMALVFFIHYIMVAIIWISNWFIGIIYNTIGGEESLYDTIRSQSYAIQASIGWPATIIYMVLIYLLVKFLFIYFKRFANVAILTFLAPIISIGFAIDKIKDGKSQSFSKWLGDYAVNVLIQPIHCLLYFLFIKLAFDIAGQSIYGVILALFLISCVSQGEKIFKKIFGLSTNSAPLGSLDDKPKSSLKKTMAKAMAFTGAAKLNAKLVGKMAKPITKPIGAGIGRIKGSMRDSRINDIKQSLDAAKAAGDSVINVKSSILGKGKDYEIDELLATGEEMGYSTQELAEIMQEQFDMDSANNKARRSKNFKKGLSSAGSTIGMVAGAVLIPSDPITGVKMFKKYSGRIKKNIKGYNKKSNLYTGTVSDNLKQAARYWGANTGIAMSIPAMAINPIGGAAMLVAFSRMRKNTIEGYNGGSGRYTGSTGGKRRIRAFARDMANFNTLNFVPMVKQVKSNMTASQQTAFAQRLTSQYVMSNNMINRRINEEYQRLLADPSVDKDELDRIITQAQGSISILGIQGEIEKYNEKDIKLVSYRALAGSVRKETDSSGNEILVIEASADGILMPEVDAAWSCAAIMDYKQDGYNIRAEFNNGEKTITLDCDKYTDAVDMFKDVMTDGGKIDEETVLKKQNEERGTEYTSLDEMYKDMIERAERLDSEEGIFYTSGDVKKLSESERQEILDEKMKKQPNSYVEKIIEAVSMKSEAEIDKEGLAEAFSDIVKETISQSTSKNVEDITVNEVNKAISAMSKDQIVEIMSIAGTKNSAVMGRKTQTSRSEFSRILSLFQKKKYNDFVIGQISYDAQQASNVAKKIRANRAKGVK